MDILLHLIQLWQCVYTVSYYKKLKYFSYSIQNSYQTNTTWLRFSVLLAKYYDYISNIIYKIIDEKIEKEYIFKKY